MSARQREYMLREQLKTIRQELGDEDAGGAEIEELESAIESAAMPEEIEKEEQTYGGDAIPKPASIKKILDERKDERAYRELIVLHLDLGNKGPALEIAQKYLEEFTDGDARSDEGEFALELLQAVFHLFELSLAGRAERLRRPA